MPRVHFVKKARKDNPAVKKGESYYHWQRYRARKQYSATPPKRSQLTGSSKLAAIYDAEDSVSNVGIDTSDRACLLMSLQSYEGAVREAAETFRDVGTEYQESADNMAEYFQGSERVYEIEEKANACEEAADNFEQWADELSDLHERLVDLGDEPNQPEDLTQDEDESDKDYEDRISEREDEIENWQSEYDDIANEAQNLEGQYDGPEL